MAMDAVRLRVEFEDRHILKKSQRSEGLKRSWLLLKPSHQAISDLSSYIFHTFNLHRSCPNGIILSMDGFVLPPFESISILKDKDVLGVRRKGKLLPEIFKVDAGDNVMEGENIVEKQALLTDVPLLANEEFEKETGGYQSEPEEDEEDNRSGDALYEEKSSERNAVSKKRKASKEIRSSKKKKKKHHIDPHATEDGFHIEQNGSSGFHPGKSSDKKKKVSNVKNKHKTSTPGSVESNDDTSQPLVSPNRSSPFQENGMECVALTQTPDGSQKFPSRSARRKKLKRQWLREIVKAEKKELIKLQSPEIDVHKHSVEDHQENQSCEADKIAPDTDAVPIVIRPGHIRFEPLEEHTDKEILQEHQVSVEILQWNGITNKKKGQKWGKEKSPSWKNEYKGSKKESSVMTPIEEVKSPIDPIDFDNLPPISSLPKEGDLIAYRLVELSSTWTPELSSFRVGETSWYDSESNRILLKPVPEYPIVPEKADEEDTFAQPPDSSYYMEDGSLEVDFSSLVNVRIVKRSNSHPLNAAIDRTHNPPMSNGVTSSTATPSGNEKGSCTPNPEKQASGWDEISEALNAKKAELMRENGWIKENSGKGAWSFRAVRGSALGPTMAMLRARNDI